MQQQVGARCSRALTRHALTSLSVRSNTVHSRIVAHPASTTRASTGSAGRADSYAWSAFSASIPLTLRNSPTIGERRGSGEALTSPAGGDQPITPATSSKSRIGSAIATSGKVTWPVGERPEQAEARAGRRRPARVTQGADRRAAQQPRETRLAPRRPDHGRAEDRASQRAERASACRFSWTRR